MDLPVVTEISRLGPCDRPSPLLGRQQRFVDDAERVMLTADVAASQPVRPAASFERAGPRDRIFFDPASAACGLVTCGGLCPGLNDVIRSVVMSLSYGYGVERIVGFRYGYAGLCADPPAAPLALDPEAVERIHEDGGTVLGSSRGPQDLDEMIATLERLDLRVLFCIGGDGTLRGASALARRIVERGLEIAVVGIPKTIDNDLMWITRSFGFSTAVEEARRSIQAAHVEAKGAWNGVGLVKLMGRHSGFIAAEACMATNDANFCLIPEVPFTLDGEGGFLGHLEQRLARKHHAVIVVAEGAGQELLEQAPPERDASGNVRLGDIGRLLQTRIAEHLKRRGVPASVKYIDPSYLIRSLPANALDSAFCLALGQHAVHAAMTGRTDLVVGHWNRRFVHVPIETMAGNRNRIDPTDSLWPRVLEATGQPSSMVGTPSVG
jgi:6-phosphofructokinase 1